MGIAAVIPLNYKDDRLEHSILYASNDWSELERILVHPSKEFKKLQKKFRKSPAPWILKAPVTLIMEPVNNANGKLLLALFGFFFLSHPGFPQDDFRSVSAESMGTTLREVFSVSSYVEADALIRKVMAHAGGEANPDGGAFLVEFAADTHALNIYYLLPKGDALPGDRFPKGVPVTLCVLGMATELCGTLHFDLDVPAKERSTSRAALIMDFIEDRQRLTKTLNEPPNCFAKFNVGFIQPGMEFPQMDTPAVQRPDKCIHPFEPCEPPRVYIEGMSFGATIPCCPLNIVATEQGYGIVSLECKNYTAKELTGAFRGSAMTILDEDDRLCRSSESVE